MPYFATGSPPEEWHACRGARPPFTVAQYNDDVYGVEAESGINSAAGPGGAVLFATRAVPAAVAAHLNACAVAG